MTEIIEALNMLEREKNISKEEMMLSIEKAVASACEKDFGENTEYSVQMDRETGDIRVYTHKTVVSEIIDSRTDITLEDARMIDPSYDIDDEVPVEITTKDFGRIAAQKARGIILQNIKEGERKSLYTHFKNKEKQVVVGVVQRFVGNNISVSLDDKTDTILSSKEMIPGERYRIGSRIKLYVIEVKENQKGGFRIVTSRTHPDLVRRLFEREVTEIADGTVEIKSISREPGSRSKIAVWSNNPDVDPVGACVGLNGNRVNSIVDDLNGEKIDIIEWDEDPAIYIENALRPSKVVSVDVDPDEKSARVVVPDYQLSLAIGKEGQNARLAARLTEYKIDIKSETQAAELEAALAEYEKYAESLEDGEEDLDVDDVDIDETEDIDDVDADVEDTDADEADAEETSEEEAEEGESEEVEED